MPKAPSATLADAALLAALQLLQPAKAAEVFEFAGKMDWAKKLTEKKIDARLGILTGAGFLHKTGDARFVLTPIGSALAASSMKPKDRDKFRMLILNSSRHTKQLRWMHG